LLHFNCELKNEVGTIPGIISPTLTGFILGDDAQSKVGWQRVFLISTAVDWFGTIVWLLFSSGAPQDL
jgi:hypothetical protein